MKRKNDVLLNTLKAMVPFWNIMVFAYVWALYYNEQTSRTLWWQLMLASTGLYVIIYYAFGKLYRAFKIGTCKISELMVSQVLSFGIADAGLYLECILIHQGIVSILPGLAAAVIQATGSLLFILLIKHWFLKYIPPQKTIIIYGGDWSKAERFKEKLQRKLVHIYEITECYSQDCEEKVLEQAIDMSQTIFFFEVDEPGRVKLLERGIHKGKNIYLTPQIEDILLSNFENRHMVDTPLLKAKAEKNGYKGKRAFDIAIAVIMLLVFSPVMLITIIAIKLEDRGPIFFKQKRVTYGGKEFDILKFRSMVMDAEKNGYCPCSVHDDRITHVGHFIRATHLDELPQLINILKGDMSIVGPRPERIEHVEKYTKELPEFSYRLRARGGLTGYAQIYGKYNTSAEDKLKMDLMYIEKQSFLLDIQLIFLTAKVMFMPENTEGFQVQATQIQEK